MEVVSSSLDLQQSTSAQGAGGSPDPPWCYGEHRAKGETTSISYLSKHALWLSLGSREVFHFHECCSLKLVCAFSVMGPRWVPPELAKCGVMGPVHTRPFQAASAFSPKGSTFGGGVQLRRLPELQRCTGRRKQPRQSSAIGRAQG